MLAVSLDSISLLMISPDGEASASSAECRQTMIEQKLANLGREGEQSCCFRDELFAVTKNERFLLFRF
jgi:hypothetical protein